MDYSVLDLIPEPVFVVNKQHKVIFANKKAKEVYGKWEGTCYEISHGFLRPCYEYEGHPCPVKNIQELGLEKSGVVHIHKTPEGKRYFYVIASYDPKEDVYIEFHVDLFDLYESIKSYTQKPLSLFFEGPLVLFQWKREEGWPVEFVSPNVKDLLGYTAEDFTSGRIKYAELIHPEDIERVAEEVEYHTRNKSPSWTHQDYRLKRKDGSYIWVLDHTMPLLDSNGEIVGYYGYVMDITERHEKEELFRLLVETNPNAVLIYDFHQNKILYANTNTAKLTGYSLEELLNMENPLELIHPEDRYRAIENINKRKQGYKKPISYYVRILRKDGRLRYVKLTSIVTSYKGKDVSFLTLNDLTKEIRRERKLRKLATIDTLTKIYNRYVLFSTLEHLIEYAERYGETFSVIIFDIDNFKLLNDTYGHLAGDRVLREIAKEVKKIIRRSDIFGRYGGEEFLIILPKTKDPYPVAEKIRKAVESIDFEKGIRVTISLGGTVYRKGDTVDSIINRADEALYLAKQSGKNQTVIL